MFKKFLCNNQRAYELLHLTSLYAKPTGLICIWWPCSLQICQGVSCNFNEITFVADWSKKQGLVHKSFFSLCRLAKKSTGRKLVGVVSFDLGDVKDSYSTTILKIGHTHTIIGHTLPNAFWGRKIIKIRNKNNKVPRQFVLGPLILMTWLFGNSGCTFSLSPLECPLQCRHAAWSVGC